MFDKQAMRRAMRQMRRALPAAKQREACEALARHLGQQAFFQNASHIAFYMPSDGEIDPGSALELAHRAGKTLYLPVLDILKDDLMHFVPWQPGEPLVKNRYGILEPVHTGSNSAPLARLDLVCLPLVAFDPSGNRLGMGGGFYDRTFAQPAKGLPHKPLLVGLAHHFQQAESLPCDPWDVPLHAVATDQGVTFTPRNPS
ncbi:MAG: 5-formyltetrahydrofolate cyclo-ligase [Porticoccaceae bacterium]